MTALVLITRTQAASYARWSNSLRGTALRMCFSKGAQACLPPAGEQLEASSIAGGRGTALVVGLGGGGLPVFLSRCCGLSVHAVELDPVVADLARRHFGFCDGELLRVRNWGCGTSGCPSAACCRSQHGNSNTIMDGSSLPLMPSNAQPHILLMLPSCQLTTLTLLNASWRQSCRWTVVFLTRLQQANSSVVSCVRQARVGDGLDAVAEAAAAVESGTAPPLDLLIVDASSSDASQAGHALCLLRSVILSVTLMLCMNGQQ